MLPLCVKVAALPLLSLSLHCHCTLPSSLYMHTSLRSVVTRAHLMCLLEGSFLPQSQQDLSNEPEKSSLICL